MSDAGINNIAEDVDQIADLRDMKLDLSKDEKLRTAALLMAIRYHTETIIKDADYLQLMINREKEAKFSNDPDFEPIHLRPSTVNAVVRIAHEFEQFLLGRSSLIESVSTEEIGREQGTIPETES